MSPAWTARVALELRSAPRTGPRGQQPPPPACWGSAPHPPLTTRATRASSPRSWGPARVQEGRLARSRLQRRWEGTACFSGERPGGPRQTQLTLLVLGLEVGQPQGQGQRQPCPAPRSASEAAPQWGTARVWEAALWAHVLGPEFIWRMQGLDAGRPGSGRARTQPALSEFPLCPHGLCDLGRTA